MPANHQTANPLVGEEKLQQGLVRHLHLLMTEGDSGQFAFDQDDLVVKLDPSLRFREALRSVSLMPLHPLMVGQ